MPDRIERVRAQMRTANLDALIVSSTENIGYITGLFLFPPNERDCHILITPKHVYLYTDSRYSGMVKSNLVTIIETGARTGFYDDIQQKAAKEKLARIGFEEASLTVQEFVQLKKSVRSISKLIPASDIYMTLRMQKDTDEIKKITAACKLTDAAFRYILPFIKLGVTEKELVSRIEYFFKKNGALPAFEPIVAFGKHAAIPHHISGNKKLTASDIYVLFDFGAKVDQYNADLSRTVFPGSITNSIEKEYDTVLHAQLKAIDALGTFSAQEADNAARDFIEKAGFPTIPHAVGHSIGIAVHEAPALSPREKKRLAPNMVVTVEPGIYLPNKGGIRVEDTVLLRENGPLPLTKAPKECIVLPL